MEQLKALHQKIQDYEDHLSPQVKNGLQCAKGCSQCCKVDLSIFKLEADFILKWWNGVPHTEKEKILKDWKKKPTDDSGTANQEGTCAFLVEDFCTIYPARPVICRTQGFPIQIKNELGKWIRDICPLNEDVLPHTDSKTDFLNLEILNQILSGLEINQSGGVKRERIKLKDLKNILIHLS